MTWCQLTATVPGQYRCSFLIPPALDATIHAAFVANSILLALPPVHFPTICFVLAIMKILFFNNGHQDDVMMNIVVSKGVHIGFFWCQPVQSLWACLMYHVYNDSNPFLKHYMYIPLLLY